MPDLATGVLAELNLSRIGEQTSFPVVISIATASPHRRAGGGGGSSAAGGGGGSSSGGGGGSGGAGGNERGEAIPPPRTAQEGSQEGGADEGEGGHPASELRVYCLVEAEGPTKVLTFSVPHTLVPTPTPHGDSEKHLGVWGRGTGRGKGRFASRTPKTPRCSPSPSRRYSQRRWPSSRR